MSNPALLRLLRGDALSASHVGAARGTTRDREGYAIFNGEQHTFSAAKMNESHDYSKKENREETKKKKGDTDSGSESDDDGDDGPKKKKGSPIHAKGSDADGDGKKNEGKKVTDFSDKDKNGKPDAFEKKKK